MYSKDKEDCYKIVQSLKSNNQKTRDKAEEAILILLAARTLKANDAMSACVGALLESIDRDPVL